MNPPSWSMRRLAPLAVVAVAAGAAGAQAASGGAAPAPVVARPAPATAARSALVTATPIAAAVPTAKAPRGPSTSAVARAAAAAARARARARARIAPAFPATAAPLVLTVPPQSSALPAMPRACERGRRKAAAPAPPSEALKNAFGILRSEPDDDDALPTHVLKALKARGLAPVDPRSARLLRADRRKRAWVVPVPDVDAAAHFACPPGSTPAANDEPHEGLAVIAVNGAPAGGGGALRDLRRGLAPAAVDPCAGLDRDMLGISGIVPDGVEAVFATAADGSATRADVRDNGYSFVLARPRRPESRYLVWTGADGTPHVQPLPLVFASRGRYGGCARVDLPARVTLPPRVTPEPFASGCGRFDVFAAPPPRIFAPAAPAPRVRRARPRPRPRPLGVLPAPVGPAVMSTPGTLPCLLGTPSAILSQPPAALPAPAFAPSVRIPPAPRPARPRPRRGP